jgi:hypothetical protein
MSIKGSDIVDNQDPIRSTLGWSFDNDATYDWYGRDPKYGYDFHIYVSRTDPRTVYVAAVGC